MIIRFSDEIMNTFREDIFNHIPSLSIDKFLTYIINSRYRKAVVLKSWIKKQVDNPSANIRNLLKDIPDCSNFDDQINVVYSHVKKILTYVGDTKTWDMPEYWQTAEESSQILTGDCEDGAILMYVLARLKGIPANRLLLFCGWVKSGNGKGGHCYLGYKPKNYPLNWVFMDWCYYPSSKNMQERNKFLILNKEVSEYRKYKEEYEEIPSKYLDIWFAFNENNSFTRLRIK